MFQVKENVRRFLKPLYLKNNYVSVLVEAVICVKEEDLVISDYIARTGAWELENVENLMKAMSLYKDAVLVGKLYFKDIF